GVRVLDHLLSLLAQYASFDLALEVAPGDAEAEVAAAGRALGQALASAFEVQGCRRHRSAGVPGHRAPGGGLTLHVRLMEGWEPDHVLEAIFKALGVALAQSCRKRRREE